MTENFLGNEPLVRLGAFAGILAAMALWELLAPRRRQSFRRSERWPSNLGIVALDTLLVRFVFPLTAVGVAVLAETRGFGLLQMLHAPAWLALVSAVVLLDLAIYFQDCCLGSCRRCALTRWELPAAFVKACAAQLLTGA
jgi:hypothetical protein